MDSVNDKIKIRVNDSFNDSRIKDFFTTKLHHLEHELESSANKILNNLVKNPEHQKLINNHIAATKEIYSKEQQKLLSEFKTKYMNDMAELKDKLNKVTKLENNYYDLKKNYNHLKIFNTCFVLGCSAYFLYSRL